MRERALYQPGMGMRRGRAIRTSEGADPPRDRSPPAVGARAGGQQAAARLGSRALEARTVDKPGPRRASANDARVPAAPPRPRAPQAAAVRRHAAALARAGDETRRGNAVRPRTATRWRYQASTHVVHSSRRGRCTRARALDATGRHRHGRDPHASGSAALGHRPAPEPGRRLSLQYSTIRRTVAGRSRGAP